MRRRSLLRAAARRRAGSGGGGGDSASILALTPKGYWKLDETSGTTLTNAISAGSGGSGDGVIAGLDYTRVAGIKNDGGMALRMNGISGTAFRFPQGGASFAGLTFGVTAKFLSLSSGYFFHLGDTSVSGSQGVYASTDANGAIAFGWFSGGWQSATSNNGAVAANTVVRIVLRFNSTTSVSIFINGALFQTMTVGAGFVTPPSVYLNVGTVKQGSFTPNANAIFDDVFMVNRAISNAEAATL